VLLKFDPYYNLNCNCYKESRYPIRWLYWNIIFSKTFALPQQYKEQEITTKPYLQTVLTKTQKIVNYLIIIFILLYILAEVYCTVDSTILTLLIQVAEWLKIGQHPIKNVFSFVWRSVLVNVYIPNPLKPSFNFYKKNILVNWLEKYKVIHMI
jgi:hypothetical protein